MNWLFSAVFTGITSFAATNLDDMVILIIFFSQVKADFRSRHILIGQYLGFCILILASLPGFFGGLIIPDAWVGLLGIVPIVIGLRQLFNSSTDDAVQTVSYRSDAQSPRSRLVGFLPPQTYHVAAVTVANGGDNIGTYVPLFANSDLVSLLVIIGVFLVLVGVWCGMAYYLARHPSISPVLTRYGDAIVPYVLIAIGLSILIENGSYHLLPIHF